MKNQIKFLLFLCLLLFTFSTVKAQRSFEPTLVKYELAGNDTVNTVRDTLSRKISAVSNTLKDMFENAYRVCFISSANRLKISNDPSFPTDRTIITDSLSTTSVNLYETMFRSSTAIPNIYIRANTVSTATYYFRIEGF